MLPCRLAIVSRILDVMHCTKYAAHNFTQPGALVIPHRTR
jgi:hypothetical protein